MKRVASLVCALLLGSCTGSTSHDGGMDGGDASAPGPITLTSANATVTVRLAPFGMQVRNAAGAVLLDTIAPGTTVTGDTHAAFTPLGTTHREQTILPPTIEGWDHVRGVDATWLHGTQVLHAMSTDTSASLDLVDPAQPATVIHLQLNLDGAELRVDATLAGSGLDAGAAQGALNEFGQAFTLGADEHFFGLGERSVTVDHRGQLFECWVEEGGLGAGEGVPPSPINPFPHGPGMTHLPIPFVISSRGYGLWLDTTYRTGFSLGAESPTAWRVYAVEPALHYRVLVHADPRDTIAHFTQLVGRARVPAPWVFGPRRRVDHGQMVDGIPEEQALRVQHVPTTMVDDTNHFLPINAALGRETFLAGWTQQMHALGFKAIGYFNPHVSITDPRGADLVAYGRAHGLFVTNAAGQEFDANIVSAGNQMVTTIDLTNPDAVVWYDSLLQQALDLGYDGWMLDFGEYIPPTALLHDGRSGWEAHNAFPLVVQSTVWNYLSQVRGNDFQYFARSGYTGTQSVTPVVWSGDPSASFDDTRGLPSHVRAAMNAGMSGIPFWGSDISGYTCIHDPPPDKEVYLRWAEFGAFSPDMHDENACSQAPPGSPPKWTLWSDAETTLVYGNYARLHTRMLPYILAAAHQAADTGMPIVRHPMLLHPTESATFAVDAEYYFGDALYVAPVVHRGDLTRTFWLPPGVWTDFTTGDRVAGAGTSITRDAPVDTIPVLLRSGGIVPLLDPSVETLAPHTDPSVVGMADVAGMLDVIAAIDPGTAQGHTVLADGSVLEMSLTSAPPALPASITVPTDASALAACTTLCGRTDVSTDGAVTRVRITTPVSTDAVVQAGGLTLHHHTPTPMQIRWDVRVVTAP